MVKVGRQFTKDLPSSGEAADAVAGANSAALGGDPLGANDRLALLEGGEEFLGDPSERFGVLGPLLGSGLVVEPVAEVLQKRLFGGEVAIDGADRDTRVSRQLRNTEVGDATGSDLVQEGV